MEMSAAGENRPGRRELAVLALILMLGAVLRLAYWRELAEFPEALTPRQDQVDMAFFDNYGRDLANGARELLGMARPPDNAGPVDWTQEKDEPFVRPPGYSWFVAGVYFLGGNSPLALRSAQMALGLFSAVLAWLLGRRLLGGAGGLMTAAFMAFYWVLLVYEGSIHAQTLVVFLSLASVLLTVRWAARPSLARAAAAGAATGMLLWTASAFVLFVPVLCCWMCLPFWKKGGGFRRAAFGAAARALPHGLALGAAMAAMVLPVTAANYRACGNFHLISAGGGVVFLIGNHDRADGYYRHPEEALGFPYTGDNKWHEKQLEKLFGHKPSWEELSRYCGGKALEWIAAHPARYAALTAKRACLFWTPMEISHNVMEKCEQAFSPTLKFLPGGFRGLFALFISGIALFAIGRVKPSLRPLSWNTGGLALVLLFMLVWYAPYAVFFYVTAHYRVPLLPFVALFAALAVLGAWDAARAGRWRVLCAVLLPGAAVYAVSWTTPVDYGKDVERWLYFRTTPLEERGDLDTALLLARRAADSELGDAAAHLRLGDLLRRAGKAEEATAAYEKGLGLRPNSAQGGALYQRIGSMRWERGDREGAANFFKLALTQTPDDFTAIAGLGQYHLENGETGKALALLERGARLRPDNSNIHFLTGLALQQAGRAADAEAAFRRGIAADPKDPWPLVGLGGLLEAAGRSAEARDAYGRARALSPENPQAAEGLKRLSAAE